MSESTNLKSLQFTWKITNYGQQKFNNKPGKRISSQAFPGDCEDDLEFTLYFYPQGSVQSGDNEVSEKWASLYLKAESSKNYDTFHHFEFSILDANGEKLGIHHFHKTIPFQKWGYLKFILLTDLENPANNLLQNNTLTICCRIEDTKSETKQCYCLFEYPQTTRARRKLVEDLATLKDKQFADFVFKVENEKIPVHRAILAARSPVFSAMFQHDMQEKRTNETEIKDVTPAAFKALLQFIYTGHCEVENLAEQLFVAAIKYDMRDLKQICDQELRKKLTVDNAVDLLVFSDVYMAENLKDGAIRFINKNAPAVMKTPSWSNFPRFHQHLIFELYRKLF
jgi:speckle-type POZ protein